MTRFARAGKRTSLEASTWNDLSEGVSASTESNSKKDVLSSKKEEMFHKKKNKSFGQTEKEKEMDPKRQKKIEARRLRRRKSKCCFVCRQYGHQAIDCPNKEEMKIGTCFKCGAADHTTRSCKATPSLQASGPFPFAKCFICQEMGHLSKSCPENPRGLYPRGGGCKVCGSVEHLKRDCPQLRRKKTIKGEAVSLTTFETSVHTSADAQELKDEPNIQSQKKRTKSKRKIVHF